MKIQGKYVVAGVIMLGSVTLGLLYLQYQKIKDFCISLKQIKVNNFTWNSADLDVFITFRNKSKIKLTIFSQEYLVFLNDKQVLKVSNIVPQIIAPESDSPISDKLQFSPKLALEAVRMNLSDIITKPDQIIIKIQISVTAGVGILKHTIPFDISMTLKELMAGKGNNNSSIKC